MFKLIVRGDLSNWAGPYAFMTACDIPTAISAFPWNYDFETGSICDFITADSLNNGNEWVFDSGNVNFPNATGNYGFVSAQNQNGANAMLITPEFDLSSFTAGHGLEITFESNFQDYSGNAMLIY